MEGCSNCMKQQALRTYSTFWWIHNSPVVLITNTLSDDCSTSENTRRCSPPPPWNFAFSEGRELCCKLVIQFSCYFFVAWSYGFEKPPFSHSIWSIIITAPMPAVWQPCVMQKLLTRFPIAQYIYRHNSQLLRDYVTLAIASRIRNPTCRSTCSCVGAHPM